MDRCSRCASDEWVQRRAFGCSIGSRAQGVSKGSSGMLTRYLQYVRLAGVRKGVRCKPLVRKQTMELLADVHDFKERRW